MRALVYTAARTLDVMDVEMPAAGEGEVLVRVERAGICGSDVQGVATRSPRRTPPLIMGHELIGEVMSASPEAGALVGSRVAVNPQVPCGLCSSCRSGHENICQHRELVGGTRPGGFGEFVVGAGALRSRHRRRVGRRRCGAGRAGCNVHPCVSAQPACASRNRGRARRRDDRDAGLRRRAPPRRRADRRQRAERRTPRLGRSPSRTRRCVPDELSDTLLAAPRSEGAALVVDAVGSDATRAASVALLQPGGCALWLGMHDAEATIPAFDLVVREQSIRGSFAYTDADFAAAVDAARRASRSVSPPDEDMLARGRRRRVRRSSWRARWTDS